MNLRRASQQARDGATEPTIKALRVVSVNLSLMAISYAIFYFGPSEWVRIPRDPEDLENQVSIVQKVEGFGPVWPFLFMLGGVLVLCSTLLGRGVIVAHGVAAGVWVTYGLAILLGALLSLPPTPILSGGGAIFAAITHIGMARAWAGEGIK